jgi:uncharacterized membrane-anchored protein YjiN (DUF445 family)
LLIRILTDFNCVIEKQNNKMSSNKKSDLLKDLKKELYIQKQRDFKREIRKNQKERKSFPKVKRQLSSSIPPDLNRNESAKRKRMKRTSKDCSTENENSLTIDREDIEAANNLGNFKSDSIPVLYKHLNISLITYRFTYSESARTISESNSK